MRTTLFPSFIIFIIGLTVGWLVRPLLSPPATTVTPLPAPESSSEPAWQKSTPNALTTTKHSNPPLINFAESTRSLLKQQRYNDAIQVLHSVELVGDDQLHRQLRNLVLEEVAHLIKGHIYNRATDLLTAYLRHSFNDVDALRELGVVQLAQGKFMAAINTLYSAVGHASQLEEQDSIRNQIRVAVKTYTERLQESKKWRELISTYEQLITLAPGDSSYYLALANTQIMIKDYQGARKTLNIIRHDTTVTDAVNELSTALEQSLTEAAASQAGVPLKQRNGHYLVTALINDTMEVTLLLDTGASLTSLIPDALTAAGYTMTHDVKQRVLVNTANGQVEAPLLNLNTLSIGGLAIPDVAIVALPMEGMSGVDGLLGMNYLQHFEFRIDQKRGVLHLTPQR